MSIDIFIQKAVGMTWTTWNGPWRVFYHYFCNRDTDMNINPSIIKTFCKTHTMQKVGELFSTLLDQITQLGFV